MRNTCLRRTRFALWSVAAMALLAAGCSQQMAQQPSSADLRPSTFFADRLTIRPRVPQTVARGEPWRDATLLTGGVTANDPATAETVYTSVVPFAVDHALLRRGRENYNIYCAVCHDALGTGRGIIVERGYAPPPSFHIRRLRDAPIGYFFAVATEGFGAMPEYGDQIPLEERWAIAVYLRVLQKSQNVDPSELSDQERARLSEENAIDG